MKLMKLSLIAGAWAIVAASAHANPPISIEDYMLECNWGELTMGAAKDDGKKHGKHAADPSDDGHGPGTLDEPRAGLANATGSQGDLPATCEFIEGML